MVVILSISSVQTRLAKLFTDSLNKSHNTNISIKKVDLSLLGMAKLNDVTILDHHQDTLIYVSKLTTSIFDLRKILKNNLNINSVSLGKGKMYLKTYKNEKDHNLDIFIEKLDDSDTPSENPFGLNAKNLYIEDLTFTVLDLNYKDSLDFSAKNIGAYIENFNIKGSEIQGDIKGAYFTDNRNIKVENLTTDFTYNDEKIALINTSLKTNNNTLIKGDINFFSHDDSSYSDFLNKVPLKASIKKSRISVYDLKKFENDFSGSDLFYIDTNISGTLNKLYFKYFKLKSRNGIKADGNFSLVNSFSKKDNFKFDAEINHLITNYTQLLKLLPSKLDTKLNNELAELGNFNLKGIIKVRPNYIDSSIDLKTELGGTISNLHLTDITNSKKAKYEGTVKLHDFDLGKIIGDDSFGKVTMNADIDGKGLSKKLTSGLKGKIEQLEFRGYTCKNIDINGKLKKKKFDGILKIDDENVKLDFEGLADFSSKVNKFNFIMNIDKLDLNKTHLFEKDSISELKGNFILDLEGNTIDDIRGKGKFTDFWYYTADKKYEFKNLDFSSQVKDSIRTIKFNSDKAINGFIKGKFLFKELISISRNALLSSYPNYEPIPVLPNQFIDFDFTVYNEMAEIFLNHVTIKKNAHFKGAINSTDNNLFIKAIAPKVTAYGVKIDSLDLKVNNKIKNHTIVNAQKIRTRHYKINDFQLFSNTLSDTIYFNTRFKGGTKKEDDYDIQIFHTLDQNKESVVGLKKSSCLFKGNNWLINPENDTLNKISYNYDEKLFKFQPFFINSKNQEIRFDGEISKIHKQFNANLKDLQLTQILPDIEDFKLEGILNGTIKIDDHEIKNSTANLEISDFVINDVSQGVLKAEIQTLETYKKYNIDLAIRDYNFDNLKINGLLDFSHKKPLADLKIHLKDYELDGYRNIIGEDISNIRGAVSGDFTAKGKLVNPDFNGFLNFKRTGLGFSYLNIDFEAEENAKVRLKNQSFIFDKLLMTDSKYNTFGYISGNIRHIKFSDWYLDLLINSKNLLVLDTHETEEEPYYGTAFLDGSAKIKGKTSSLRIDVEGKTEENTSFIIPLKEVTFEDRYELIKFVKKKKKTKKEEKESDSGVSFSMNLEVNPKAMAKVVIDKVNKNELEGRGRGNIDVLISSDGNFKMVGDLKIEEGSYNFRYTGIPKKFEVQKGSTISWNGDPFKAELDIIALYKARANPAQLLDNVVSNRKIPVDLYTKITGELFESKQEFDIKIPSADSSIASELEFRFENNTNSKMLNFASLLLGNTFYDDQANGNFATNFATSTASDVLSNIISDVFNSEDSKLRFNIGYTQADKSEVKELIYDNQVDLSFQGILSDRVIFNGKLGVPVGNSNMQSSIVGEGNLEVILNESGSLRWKIFNKPNDIQYSMQEEGFTQGTSISYQVDYSSFSELIRKILNKDKKPKKEETNSKQKAIIRKKNGKTKN